MEVPIRIEEFIKLQDVGINPANIKLSSLTMEYDRSINVREVIVDITNRKNPIRKNFSKDSAILNPSGTFIAWKEKNDLLVSGINETDETFTCWVSDPAVFFTWIDIDTIALITKTSIYHWNREGCSAEEIGNLGSQLNGCRITNYMTDRKFLVIIGISTEVDHQQEGGFNKTIQFDDIGTGYRKCFEARAAVLGEIKMLGDGLPSKFLIYVTGRDSNYKLCFDQVSFQPESYDNSKTVGIFLAEDYPVDLQVIQKYDVICMITFHCVVYFYHMETAICVCRKRISIDTIFLTTPKFDGSGFLAVTQSGQVYSIEVDEKTLIAYINYTFNMPDLTMKIAIRSNLPNADEIVSSEFESLFEDGKYEEAAKLAAKSRNDSLRTDETIQKFEQIGENFPLHKYFDTLMNLGTLNKIESKKFVTTFTNQLKRCIENDKLSCTWNLGDLIKDSDLAKHVFYRANMPKEMVDFVLGNLDPHLSIRDTRKKCMENVLLLDALQRSEREDYIKKILEYAHRLPSEKLLGHFRSYKARDKLIYLEHMLEANVQQNFKICSQIAMKYRSELNTQAIISMFEKFKCYQGVSDILKDEVKTSLGTVMTLKYINACCHLGNFDETENIFKKLECSDEKLLEDNQSLITTCSNFKYVHGLVFFLMENQLNKWITTYLKVNPHTLPAIVEGVMDYYSEYPFNQLLLAMGTSLVRKLIMDSTEWFSTEKLVEVLEMKKKRDWLQEWLESRVKEGCIEQATHDALMKNYIDTNPHARTFLQENDYYNCNAIGKYCLVQKKPELAMLAYEHGYKYLDRIGVRSQSDIIEDQTRHLVHLKGKLAWDKALDESNIYRGQMVTMITKTNMFGSKREDEIRMTLQALYENNFKTHYVQLLEHVVSAHPDISDENDYETELILTAIDGTKVFEYIQNLENYVVSEVAVSAINAGLQDVVVKLIDLFSISLSAILGIFNRPSTNWDQVVKLAELQKDSTFKELLCHAQTCYGCKVDTACKCQLNDKQQRTTFWNWLTDLSKKRIFHNDSNYLDLRYLLKHIATTNNVHFKCEPCLWQMFDQKKNDCESPKKEDEHDCISIAIAFNDDFKNILLVRKENRFSFPEIVGLRKFGFERILWEKFSCESYVIIKSSKPFKCYYLFGVFMWKLPQRSKYAWHEVSELRNKGDVDGDVLDVLKQIGENGHLPLVASRMLRTDSVTRKHRDRTSMRSLF